MADRGLAKGTSSLDRPRYQDVAVTGNPWLDGALFARGSRRSHHSISLRVGHTPHALLPELEIAMEKAGFEVGYQLVPHAITRKEELYLIGQSPNIACGPMGPFQQRRLPFPAPREFLAGFFFMACEPRVRVEIGAESPPVVTHLAIASWGADDDLEIIPSMLAAWGIQSTTRRRRSVCILPEDAARVPPFDRILEAAYQETKWAHNAARPLTLERDESPERQDARLQPLLATIYGRRVAAARILREIPLSYARRKAMRRFAAVPQATLDEVRLDCAAYAASPNGSPIEDAMVGLARRYDAILRSYFAKSWDYATLIEFARGGPTRRESHRLDGSEKRELRRRRKRLEEFFELQLRERLANPGQTPRPRGSAPPASAARILLECAREVYALQGGFHFRSPSQPLPEYFLRECGGCQSAAVLSFGGRCRECGASLCRDCERGFRRLAPNRALERLLCPRHVAAPENPPHSAPTAALTNATRAHELRVTRQGQGSVSPSFRAR